MWGGGGRGGGGEGELGGEGVGAPRSKNSKSNKLVLGLNVLPYLQMYIFTAWFCKVPEGRHLTILLSKPTTYHILS